MPFNKEIIWGFGGEITAVEKGQLGNLKIEALGGVQEHLTSPAMSVLSIW